MNVNSPNLIPEKRRWDSFFQHGSRVGKQLVYNETDLTTRRFQTFRTLVDERSATISRFC